MAEKFTDFEYNVIQKLLAGDCEAYRIVLFQIGQAIVSRTYTGAGFFLEFDVPSHVPTSEPKTFRVGDVHGDISGLEFGAGFILFVENGVVQQLEGFSYEEPWPDSIDDYQLRYTKEPREFPPSSTLGRTNG